MPALWVGTFHLAMRLPGRHQRGRGGRSAPGRSAAPFKTRSPEREHRGEDDEVLDAERPWGHRDE